MYKLTKSGVKRLSDGAHIPNDPKNKDWRKFQKWVDEGNTPEPEFTTEELEEKKQRKIKSLEIRIVDMRLRKDGASAEGLTELETETETELIELRAELIAETEESS